MSNKSQIILSSITILMVLIMGYAFEQNTFALNNDPADNLPLIVQAFHIEAPVPVMV